MSNGFLKVELIQQYDPASQKFVEDRSVKVMTQALQSGIVKDIGLTEFGLLMVIASFCDVEGEAFPSQRKLAELTGLSLPTVNKAVNRLLETKINGQPIIARELESMGSKKRFSVYSLGTTEEEQEKKRTARDFVAKFKNNFEEQFGFPYIVNYAKDTSVMKKKLMGEFGEEELDAIIDYAIKNYVSKWANSKFPYPTIGMLGSWLGNTVMIELKKEQKQAEEVKELIQDTAQFVDADYENALNMLD